MSASIVLAVSEFEDEPFESLPPLSNSVDPDALDDLYARGNEGGAQFDGRLSFEYNDTEITIKDEGQIRIQPTGPGKPQLNRS